MKIQQDLISEEVYIAGPLFNTYEREHNRKMALLFKKVGYTVFNPLENGINASILETLTEDELVRRIHQLDFQKAIHAKILIANLNGVAVDDGTAVEIGMAYTAKKFGFGQIQLILGYLTDTRVVHANMRRNPLITGSCDKVFEDEQEMLEYALKNCPPSLRAI